MPFGGLLTLGGLAVAGGVAGAMGTPTTQASTAGVKLGANTGLENSAATGVQGDYDSLRRMVSSGANEGDVANATGAQRSLAQMLQQYSQGGYMPSSGDISSSNSLASSLFNPQQVALNQSFLQQRQDANTQAALMGRAGDDPVLRAKLAQQQTNMQAQLSANQGAWATNYSMQQPMMRLGFAQDNANVLGGLATQAMANRQALAGMGSSLLNNERNWQYQTADRWGNSDQQTGGGVGGAIKGAIGGLGAGASLMGGMGGMGGGGGAGGLANMGGNVGASTGSSFFSGPNPYSVGGAGSASAAGAYSPPSYSFGSNMFSGAKPGYSLMGSN